MRQTLINYIRASFPALAIQTTDEVRAQGDIVGAAKECNKTIVTWSATEGMFKFKPGSKDPPKQIDDTNDLRAACAQREEQAVYVMRDPHTWPFDSDPFLLRAFRDFIQAAPQLGSTVVVLAHDFKPHPCIEKLVTILDYELPSKEELTTIAKGIAESTQLDLKVDEDLLRALGGLTAPEAENALALSVIEKGGFDPKVIYREKVKAVKRTGLLDIVEPDPRGLDAIGGLDVLKKWIGRRRRVWSRRAKKFGLPNPKGVMLVGVPGTGKSLSAKAFGTALAVPTVRLDVSSLFNSLVGESERRTREALALAGALAPCVLWVDEIDKGLAGSSGSGSGDSGVTKRLFGIIIEWLQNRTRPVFLVATANNVESLPPELLRKGRFDELFAVDLPTQREREQILAIHLRGRGRNPELFDLPAVAKAMADFTGSEVEAVLDEGLFAAFDDGGDDEDAPLPELTNEHLITAAEGIVPLAKTAKEPIEAIRRWAKEKAKWASSKADESTVQAGRRFG